MCLSKCNIKGIYFHDCFLAPLPSTSQALLVAPRHSSRGFAVARLLSLALREPMEESGEEVMEEIPKCL